MSRRKELYPCHMALPPLGLWLQPFEKTGLRGVLRGRHIPMDQIAHSTFRFIVLVAKGSFQRTVEIRIAGCALLWVSPPPPSAVTTNSPGGSWESRGLNLRPQCTGPAAAAA